MKRVISPIDLRREIMDYSSKISDKDLFCSPQFKGLLFRTARAWLKRKKHERDLRIDLKWQPKKGILGCTDNCEVYINVGHPLVQARKERVLRYWFIYGVFGHELGHALKTDFLSMPQCAGYLSGGAFFPEEPKPLNAKETANLEDMREYLRESMDNVGAMAAMIHEMTNYFEDAFEEAWMIGQFPGLLGYCINYMRSAMTEDAPTVTELIEREGEDERNVWKTICGIMLTYVTSGRIKNGETPLEDWRIKLVYDLFDVLDEAVYAPHTSDRIAAANTIIMRHWDLVKPYLEILKEKAEKDKEYEKALEELFEGLGGATTKGTGDKDGLEDDPDDPGPRPGGKLERPDKETGIGEAEAVTGPGGVTFDDSYEGAGFTAAAKDISRVLTDIAEEKVCEKEEKARTEELGELAESIDYGSIHKGVPVVVRRMATVPDKLREEYAEASPPLMVLANQMLRGFQKKLEKRKRGGKMRRLTDGKRLDPRYIPKEDYRVFSKRNAPRKESALAIMELNDESGSMGGYDRDTYARASAIIVHEFCVKAGIPICIYGHSTESIGGKQGVALYSYAEFDTIDKDDKYRLMDITARRDNRDGAALRYCCELLMQRPEKYKLFIIKCDGAPLANGYSGHRANQDMIQIVREYEKKGVHFLACAIGSDKAEIEAIFGHDSFVDISNLSLLPNRIINRIKAYINA